MNSQIKAGKLTSEWKLAQAIHTGVRALQGILMVLAVLGLLTQDEAEGLTAVLAAVVGILEGANAWVAVSYNNGRVSIKTAQEGEALTGEVLTVGAFPDEAE